MERDQELIDRVRYELDLSKEDASDDLIWENTKGSLLAERILLGMAVEDFKREIISAIFGKGEKTWRHLMKSYYNQK